MVDVRTDIPRFGQHAAIELAANAARQLWVPPGLAHGFCVLSDFADCVFKCTARYHPDTEHAVLWNDPDLAIDWPVKAPILCNRDSMAPRLAGAPVLPKMFGPR